MDAVVVFFTYNDLNTPKLYALATDGRLKWCFEAPYGLYASPVVGKDGTVYVNAAVDDGQPRLYALTPQGEVKWSFATNNSEEFSGTFGSPAVGADGAVYFGTDECDYTASDDELCRLYAVTAAEGRLKWNVTTPICSVAGVQRGMCAGNNGVGVSRLGGVSGAPTVGLDGTAYFGSADNRLYAVSPEGKLSWFYTTGDFVIGTPALGADGVVYVGSSDWKLYAVRKA